jgi:cobalt-precorrin 5A hydrolase
MSLVSGLDDIAVITLTKQGIDVARDLENKLSANVTVYISEKYDEAAPKKWSRFPRRIYPLVDEIWQKHEALIFVMAAGIVVRAVAKHVQSKLYDPGVVVMDIKAKFAVALCSGHLGGSNELCRMIEERLGSISVVTTGTDVNNTLAPDVLAKDIGARVDDWEPLKLVSGALVDSLPVGVYVEPGFDAGNLAQYAKKKVTVVETPEDLNDYRAAVVVSHRLLPEPNVPTMWLRPPLLVVGIGCNRGTSAEEIEKEVSAVLQENGLAKSSVVRIATIEKKSDEEGLLQFAAQNEWPLWWYHNDQINNDAPPFPGRSDVVFKYVGVYGVSEPASMLAAGAKSLLVQKQKRGNLTVSIARLDKAPLPPKGIIKS